VNYSPWLSKENFLLKKSHSADDQSQQHFPDPKPKGRDTVGKIYLISVGKK
jgi:hypothetical protein